MSDYIYMLDSHLSPDQNRAVEDTQAAAGLANVNALLTGGAMREMLAGFRISDLDFVVEGNALKIAKAICERTGATTVSTSHGDLQRPGRSRPALALLPRAALETEPAWAGQVREGHSRASGGHALAHRPLRNLPPLPERKAHAQGQAGADQGDRYAQERYRPVAENRGSR